MHASGSFKNDIRYAHTDYLGNTRAGVVEHRQQQMVALRSPTRAWLPEYGSHLLAGKETQHRSVEALHRDRQRALDHVQ